jgi:hypothetical protein
MPDYGGQRLLFIYSQCRIEGDQLQQWIVRIWFCLGEVICSEQKNDIVF